MNLKTMALATILLFSCGVVCADAGGEGNNTNCNGVGNPNSPCEPSDNGNGGGNGGAGGSAFWNGDIVSSTAATGGQSQATGGSATASGYGGSGGSANASTVSNGGSSSVSVNNNISTPANQTIKHKGTQTIRNVPDVANYTPPATANCYVGLSAGIGLPGFGGSIGGYVEDERCAVQELYRITYEAGDTELHNLTRDVMRDQIARYRDKAEKRKGGTRTTGGFGY